MSSIEHDIAVRLVSKLFTAFDGRVADRLALMQRAPLGEKDIGGWCREAAIEQVREVLEAELKVTK